MYAAFHLRKIVRTMCFPKFTGHQSAPCSGTETACLCSLYPTDLSSYLWSTFSSGSSLTTAILSKQLCAKAYKRESWGWGVKKLAYRMGRRMKCPGTMPCFCHNIAGTYHVPFRGRNVIGSCLHICAVVFAKWGQGVTCHHACFKWSHTQHVPSGEDTVSFVHTHPWPLLWSFILCV